MELKRKLQLDCMYAFDGLAYVTDAGRHQHQLTVCLLFSNVDSVFAVLA